ncbi:MAG: MBL fold metallo-hydrolase [Gemmatimonadetes bacterium]|nr:MBL fold metallo-hydrolase [Gemmatimonadota bacterium]
MEFRPLRSVFGATACALTMVLSGCGSGGGGTTPTPTAPTITVQGIEDGGSYESSVTFTISIDRGTYQATLDDRPLLGPSATVDSPGDYTLEVTARNQEATAALTIDFTVVGAPGGVLIVRLFDLGDNSAGGGGDAILLTDSSSAGLDHFLVDAGPAGTDGDDEDYVHTRLAALGVSELRGLLLTHAHTDHFRGMPDVLDGARVETFYHNGQVRSFAEYTSFIANATARADEVVIPATPLQETLAGGTELTILPPLTRYLDNRSAGSQELNDGSIGVLVARGAFRLFLTGDGEVEANGRWRNTYGDLTSDLTVLKVGHHGANDAIFDDGLGQSSASQWLDHTAAEFHVVSANGASHPRQRATNTLNARAETYCTNVHGDIAIRVDMNGLWSVTVERNADFDCLPGDDAIT